MGHERVGALPRTKRWQDVVDDIADAASINGDVSGLANAILENVRSRLLAIQGDAGFVASFQFLLGLSLSASPGVDRASLGDLAIDLEANPSPLKLASALGQYVADNKQSAEYAEIARKAAVDAISIWTEQQTRQLSFTGEHEQASEVWRKASDGSGFCEVARLFFGKFVERYLNYFLGREASSRVSSTEARDRLATRLQEHVDGVSHHAFETARITQSFSAGMVQPPHPRRDADSRRSFRLHRPFDGQAPRGTPPGGSSSMSNGHHRSMFLCNGESLPDDIDGVPGTALDYRPQIGNANVRLGLPDFVQSVYHLPDRFLDLLEIAAYVFAGDRLALRGSKNTVEYHSWARNLHYVMRVRDHAFWSRSDVQDALRAALLFMTGDQSYDFTFQPGHSTPPADLFDSEVFQVESADSLSVMLFSGGLDSLAGAVQRLEETNDRVCLVSHQSSQPSIVRTQDSLVKALQGEYPGRVHHYRFRTNLRRIRAKEETQRTRSFLYGSIAFAIAHTFGRDRVFVYENGITSLNFTRRDDLLNARASRTTHPQTLGRLAQLFSIIAERPISMETPFLWKTKSDVVDVLIASGFGHLIPSSVSCSHTFKPESTEGRPWGQPLKKAEGAPLNLG